MLWAELMCVWEVSFWPVVAEQVGKEVRAGVAPWWRNHHVGPRGQTMAPCLNCVRRPASRFFRLRYASPAPTPRVAENRRGVLYRRRGRTANPRESPEVDAEWSTTSDISWLPRPTQRSVFKDLPAR